MKSSHQIGIAVLLFGAAGIATIKLGGETVSYKFSNANQSVTNQVIFGDPSDFFPTPARQVRSRSAGVVAPIQEERRTAVESTSTFAIDVDTGSYTHARRMIEEGSLPHAGQVRVEEFVNYFHYDYAQPPLERTASVQFEGAPSPFSTDEQTHLVRIGVQARGVGKPVPVHITFLVDTSGSMGALDRLPLAKAAMHATLDQLAGTDTVAIATYAGSSRLVLGATPIRRKAAIRQAIDSLEAGGGTDMGDGMLRAYEVASRHAGPGKVSRVFVMSDGDANIGRTSAHGILDDVRTYAEEGVTLSTVGFGIGNYNDEMMEQLADAGNGNYTYIDSEDEIPRAFVYGLESLLHVVAKDMKVQVEFDADAVVSWRQVGYENRQMANHEFRDDRVDAGEVGAGHQVTALYEVKLRPGLGGAAPIATVRFRFKEADGHTAREVESVMEARALRARIGHSSDDFRFQAAVATFAERMRGENGPNLAWIEEVAAGAQDGRSDRQRFVQLVRLAAQIDGRM